MRACFLAVFNLIKFAFDFASPQETIFAAAAAARQKAECINGKRQQTLVTCTTKTFKSHFSTCHTKRVDEQKLLRRICFRSV